MYSGVVALANKPPAPHCSYKEVGATLVVGGMVDGREDGSVVGKLVGWSDRAALGMALAVADGAALAVVLGRALTLKLGSALAVAVGSKLGTALGTALGKIVGTSTGAVVGELHPVKSQTFQGSSDKTGQPSGLILNSRAPMRGNPLSWAS